MIQEFDDILRAVRDWSGQVPFSPEILQGDADGLRILWETPTHLAELLVCRGEYAPYRYVSFQVLDIQRDVAQAAVYSYYDEENSTTEEILDALEQGIAHMKKGLKQNA